MSTQALTNKTAAGLRLRGLLQQVLGRVHAGRVVGQEKPGEAGAHAGPAGARHLGGPGRLRECRLIGVADGGGAAAASAVAVFVFVIVIFCLLLPLPAGAAIIGGDADDFGVVGGVHRLVIAL